MGNITVNSDNSGKYFSRGFTGWSAFHQDCHSKHLESSVSSEIHLKHAVTRSGRSDSKETVTILRRDDVYWRLTLYASSGTPAYIISCRAIILDRLEKMPFLDTIPRQTKRLFLWQPFCRKDTGVIFIK